MKMLNTILIPPKVVLLFLVLLGSSNLLFSANQGFSHYANQEDQQLLISSSLLGEQVNGLYDSILPFSKNLLYVKGFSNNAVEDFTVRIQSHTTTSLNYIKRSRYIFPGLGVKEVIFPFHVFL